ncbi:MAG: 23S rRNA (pseudouridine(1915)-N(3))-methyltransferase RlmH [Nitrosospira sp. 56-18]|jgi:23S rRNA (pseudouridine1915-N3)-methyltransferase|nr:23S rRNA (pseudouridine(1915)-N(3))-methyltransferase RlmH [Nitrosospira sp.]OJY13719.1 MAG: 23S rRNA (pseudouridine(1915)-N(3))-methyltransferase RlmH [Nitrosospira sp. 56-18]
MKFIICAVGHKMPDWVAAGFREYARRMPHEAAIELVEIKPEKRTGLKVEQLLDAEADRILAAIPSRRRLVVMDERGRQWSTARLAESVRNWMREGGDTVFIIGGADGLAAAIRNSADEVLALSALTMPHALARILLAEQLYRAVSLIKGHPYHRG